MNKYNTFEDIEFDLKRLSLERKIAVEELKGIKGEIKDDLAAPMWLRTAFKYGSKFGSIMLLKKILR